MAPVFGGLLKRDCCLQGLCDLLCLFGQLTQQNCLQMSVHNVTVHNLKVHTEALCACWYNMDCIFKYSEIWKERFH